MTPLQALQIKVLLFEVLALEGQHWICRACGAETTILSEMCSRCGREDLFQGKGTPDQILQRLYDRRNSLNLMNGADPELSKIVPWPIPPAPILNGELNRNLDQDQEENQGP